MRLAEELHRTSTVSEELWRALSEHFDERGRSSSCLVTAGWYHVIAYLCNGLHIEQEEWAARFPAPGGST